MKGEIYNYVLYSKIGTGTTSNKSYFINWGNMPDSRYKLTFTCACQELTISNTSQQPSVFINELGVSNNILCAPPTSSGSYNSGFIGTLSTLIHNGDQQLTTINANPPSFLRSKPRENIITVRIRENTETINTDYDVMDNYTMILSFEQLDD
jgi:hypothetical protein